MNVGRNDVTEPRVAVVLPIYAGTRPEHFREAVLSLRAQEGVAIRIFLGCDGPLTAPHEQLIDELLGESDVVLRADRQSGLSETLNRSIESALRDPSILHIARMDADDISVPRRLSKQTQFLATHPDVGAVGSWCIEFTEPGIEGFRKQLPTSNRELRKLTVYRSPLAHPSVMFHRGVFDAGFRYDPSQDRVEDYDLWSRMLIAGIRISNIPEYLLWYRMDPNFHARRGGWRLGAREVCLRVRYASAAGLLRPWHFVGLAAFFLVRISPIPLKKWAYRMRGSPHLSPS